MTGTVRRLRWASVGASVYFALLWVLLTNEQRYWGALVVLGAGLLLSAFSVRTLALLYGSKPAVPAGPPVDTAVPVHETVDAYSAEPELRAGGE